MVINMKKILAVLMVLGLLILATGCGKQKTNDTEDTTTRTTIEEITAEESNTDGVLVDITGIDTLEQDLDLSDLNKLESELDIQI